MCVLDEADLVAIGVAEAESLCGRGRSDFRGLDTMGQKILAHGLDIGGCKVNLGEFAGCTGRPRHSEIDALMIVHGKAEFRCPCANRRASAKAKVLHIKTDLTAADRGRGHENAAYTQNFRPRGSWLRRGTKSGQERQENENDGQ